MRVVVDAEKIGELLYKYLIDRYGFTKPRAESISDYVEKLLNLGL
jgi:hypothetical protein